MRKLLPLLLTLALPAYGQDMILSGAGSPKVAAGGGGPYAGPGDVVASAAMYGGLRAYSLAKAGNRAANVCNSGDANCADVNTLANGKFDVVTAQGAPLNCGGAGGTCTIKILYDQTGALACNSGGPASCDLTQNTIATRPTLVFNCVSTNPCMHFNGSQEIDSGGVSYTRVQPFTLSSAAQYTTTSAQGSLFGFAVNGEIGFDLSGAANTAWAYAGTSLSEPATDSSWHALQGVFNSTSSDMNVDGVACSSSCNAGTGAPSASAISLGLAFSQFMTGNVTEVGIWPTNFTGTQSSNMSSNQHAFWGF